MKNRPLVSNIDRNHKGDVSGSVLPLIKLILHSHACQWMLIVLELSVNRKEAVQEEILHLKGKMCLVFDKF